jgi:hypothetical protein
MTGCPGTREIQHHCLIGQVHRRFQDFLNRFGIFRAASQELDPKFPGHFARECLRGEQACLFSKLVSAHAVGHDEQPVVGGNRIPLLKGGDHHQAVFIGLPHPPNIIGEAGPEHGDIMRKFGGRSRFGAAARTDACDGSQEDSPVYPPTRAGRKACDPWIRKRAFLRWR